MLSNKEKADRLRECIALLQDVDVMQQSALGESDVSLFNSQLLQELISDFESDIVNLVAG